MDCLNPIRLEFIPYIWTPFCTPSPKFSNAMKAFLIEDVKRKQGTLRPCKTRLIKALENDQGSLRIMEYYLKSLGRLEQLDTFEVNSVMN